MSKLIDLRQIAGGVQLRQDVNTLQTSYDAYKVLTDIAREGSTGNYNVNELLGALKNVVDVQLGGLTASGGSVETRLTAIKDELQAKIDTVNNTPIKDRVRVTGTIDSVGGITFTQNIATTVPGIQAGAVNLYYADNRPVLDATGTNLTYDFATNVLSGVPCVADAGDHDPSDGVSYVPVGNPVEFKAFPVGSFTFEQLPADYLLDNEELNLVAYSNAIDAIVVDLAQDQDLIDHVISLVGTETVQNQIKLITDALTARVATLEGTVASNKADIEAKLGQAKTDLNATIAANKIDIEAKLAAEKAAKDATIAANKLDIEGKLATEVADRTAAVTAETNARIAAITAEENARIAADQALAATAEANRKTAYNADQDRKYEIGLVNAVVEVVDKLSATNAQTAFNISKVPTADKVRMYVNGIKYEEGVEFTVNRATKAVTWNFTDANGGFDMAAVFSVVFEYKTANAVTAPVYQ